MTVIAWDGKTLAADKLSSDGTSRLTVTKIHRAPDGSLLGVCGPASSCREMIEWYVRGTIPADFPPRQRDETTGAWLVAITPGGELLYWQTGPYPLRIEDEKFTFGSGRDYAAAAMHLGKTAAEAVQVAIDLCPECGNGIDTLELAP